MNIGALLRSRPLSLAAAALLFNGCTLFQHPRLNGNRAFIKYWPPPADSDRLRVAVKDNIDMKGVVTTAGSERLATEGVPAAEDARCLAIARARGVQFVGKTNLTEFAIALSGVNEYYGTPRNPLNGRRRLIPGGSSCGSAVAVATGMADVAFGTDTAGSIRVPAACCGIVGLKTTHGLVPLRGVFPIEPAHLDTVGPMGWNIERTVEGMELLQRGFSAKYAAAREAKPSAKSIRIGRLRLEGTDPAVDRAVDRALSATGFVVVQLDGNLREQWEQAKTDGDTVAAAGAWLSDRAFIGSRGIAARTKSALLVGELAYNTGYRDALARQHQWQKTLRQVFRKVDFIALPTLQTPTPVKPPNFRIGILEARMLALQNTVPVNFAGNPALAVPIPLRNGRVPVTSLQLIGPRLSEAGLLNAGRLVENAMKTGNDQMAAR
jgi:amidase